ncbi:PDR/VanB family oxidoreductase [Nocardia stercoris]|uniref:Oxidoreductase n=1 Tax=Nocardia stercoris TaxID=2483361 RepID=A0A3M2L650_9NOCA|nr:PDR/VanB family oxidoreductase [Nocardia stercoris]RMI31385.1 oxidoreductase [Nocardia stercoris]
MSVMEPTRAMRAFDSIGTAYRRIFAESRAADLLSRPKPVRWTGFELELSVREVRAEAADVVSLVLTAPDGGALPRWHPGSHLDVFLPSGKQRQYSLCGDPAERDAYRIAVRRLADGGGGSREMHELAPGTPLRIRGPRNAFRQIDAPSYLFLAGGIGITPILPMVRSAADRGVPWRLDYFGRTRAHLPFHAELDRIRGGVVRVHADDECGPPDLGTALAAAGPGAAIYCCGPDPMMTAARRLLPVVAPTASLHTERFSAPPVRNGRPFRIHLRRTGTTVDVAADESALQAVRRAVPGVPYSCRQGFCGTCKATVLAGEVEHRDALLPAADREHSMLICVSRAAGSDLTLDL